MAGICARFGGDYPTIQPRITRTLLRAMLDPSKPFSTHFGAIAGLAALGPRVTRLLIVPNLKAYLEVLEPHLEAPTAPGANAGEADTKEYSKKKVANAEARKVHDELKEAIGACLHQALAAKQREERERKEPGRRAELMKKEMGIAGAKAEAVKPVPASVVKGWTIAKNTLKVDVGPPPARRGKRKAAEKEAEEEAAAQVEGVELRIDPNAAEGEESEDPSAVAAQVAAAAALLGDCVMPYASNPTVADTFL